MPPPLDVSPEAWTIVREILRRHVPQYEVWAFGSRVSGRARPYSDLDLAIISEQPLPIDVLAALKEDFSESDLPWKVDIVDWARATPAFRARIAAQHVPVQTSRGECDPPVKTGQ